MFNIIKEYALQILSELKEIITDNLGEDLIDEETAIEIVDMVEAKVEKAIRDYLEVLRESEYD